MVFFDAGVGRALDKFFYFLFTNILYIYIYIYIYIYKVVRLNK
jgi:hypothetical protein